MDQRAKKLPSSAKWTAAIGALLVLLLVITLLANLMIARRSIPETLETRVLEPFTVHNTAKWKREHPGQARFVAVAWRSVDPPDSIQQILEDLGFEFPGGTSVWTTGDSNGAPNWVITHYPSTLDAIQDFLEVGQVGDTIR